MSLVFLHQVLYEGGRVALCDVSLVAPYQPWHPVWWNGVCPSQSCRLWCMYGRPEHVRVASAFATVESPALSACKVLVSTCNNRALLTTRGYTRWQPRTTRYCITVCL